MSKKLARYTDDEINHLREFMKTHNSSEGIEEIQRMKGRTIQKSTFIELCKNHDIVIGFKGQRKSMYSDEVKEFIRKVVPNSGMTIREIAQRVNLKFGTEYTPAQIKEIKVQLGVRSNWKTPKGTTGSGQFEKGVPPMSCRQVGELKCHSVDRIFFVKVSNIPVDKDNGVHSRDNYKQLNHMFYNFWHPDDPIKEGEVIMALDGNLCNYAKENLKKVSRSAIGSATSFMNNNDLESKANPEMFACLTAIGELNKLTKKGKE